MQHDNKHRPACATQGAAMPVDVLCSECGAFYEIWSDEMEPCPTCGVVPEK